MDRRAYREFEAKLRFLLTNCFDANGLLRELSYTEFAFEIRQHVADGLSLVKTVDSVIEYLWSQTQFSIELVQWLRAIRGNGGWRSHIEELDGLLRAVDKNPAPTPQRPSPTLPIAEPRRWWSYPEEETVRFTLALGTSGGWRSEYPENGTLHASYDWSLPDRSQPGANGGSLVLPWNPGDLNLLRNQLSANPPRLRADEVHEVGHRLRRAIAALPGMTQELTRAYDEATRLNIGFELTVQSNTAAAQEIPWELFMLGLENTAHPLPLLAKGLVVRRLPGAKRAVEPAGDAGGSLLLAWSDSGADVQIDRHRATLNKHLPGAVTELKSPSLADIRKTTRQLEREGRPVRVLHIVCHGTEEFGRYGLQLGGEGSKPVYANQLRTLLEGLRPHLRLILLFACDSANPGDVVANPFGSLAQAALNAGCDVLASQFPLSTKAAASACDTIYENLVGHSASLQFAWREAVHGLHMDDPDRHDWASLVLLRPR